jgi:DNA repair exonuclease SbcCD ATPase subunit
MNTASLKTIISKRFGENVTDVLPNIFKIEGKFNQRNFATYYFDCSNNLLSEDFDLLDYQKKLLSDDYYRSTGPLQWNFYLYFVTDSKELSFAKKVSIESDKAFTRKLVTTEEELIKLIEVQTKLKAQPKTKLDTALLSVWKSKLRTSGLNGIYLPKDYPKINEVFQLFLDKQDFREPLEEDRPISPLEIQTGIISSLEMDAFRSFKQNKSFEFKKVNLIRGVNGTGKTSLLEGIELCICGQTIENGSKKEPFTKLEIAYQNGSKDKYTPEDNKKFQARDRAWYGNNTLRGNTLSIGYHVYNFFDSDAAFRFTHESNTGEAVQQIFSRIVLGEQTNLVFDRIERFHEKLISELKQVNGQLKDKSNEKLMYQGRLNEFDSSSAIISTLGEIIESLTEVKWTGADLLLSDGSNRVEFQTQLSKVTSFFRMLQDAPWIDSPSISTLESELKILRQLIKDSDAFNLSFQDAFDQIDDIVKSKNTADRQIKILEKAAKYFLETDIKEINGLQTKIDLFNKNIAWLGRLVTVGVDLKEIENVSIQDAHKSNTEALRAVEEETQKLTMELSAIEKSVGVLNKLRTDLKRIGTQYVELSNDPKHCPLCNSHFPTGEVLKAIESVQNQIDEADVINSLTSRITTNNQKLLDIKDILARLNELKSELSAQNIIVQPEFEKLAISQLSSNLNAHRVELMAQVERLNRINIHFIESKLSENELTDFNLQLKQAGIDFLIGNTDLKTFEEKRKQKTDTYEELLKKEAELRALRAKNENQVIKAISDYLKEFNIVSSDLERYLEKIKDRLSKLNGIIDSYSAVKPIIRIDESESLSEIKTKIEVIEDLFERYNEIETQNKLRNEYVQKIDSLKIAIQTLDETNSRLNKAKETIEEIINNNNRENYLKDFFTENKQAILDIFKVIHLPNEFDDIQFESSDAIKLKDKNTSELRDLSEISTGQKSAFILSLFLTLNNNLQNGPPLIFFDDPIAYVDDINTLSFLDFLRDRVITTDKQVFFATANSKLANLFQQKFDFLGDDFKVIKLEKSLTT